MGLDNSKWVEIDKRQCFIDIIDGVLKLDDVRIVGFSDEGWIEPLGNTEIETIPFLLEEDDVKFFKKVIDIDR